MSISLLSEPCEFKISNHCANYVEFFFKAMPQVSDRIVNFIYNYGITTGKIYKYAENEFYVLAPINRIREGLLACFRGETILGRENINYTAQIIEDEAVISWDEAAVMKLAEEKTNEFMKRVTFEGTPDLWQDKGILDEYTVGSIDGIKPE